MVLRCKCHPSHITQGKFSFKQTSRKSTPQLHPSVSASSTSSSPFQQSTPSILSAIVIYSNHLPTHISLPLLHRLQFLDPGKLKSTRWLRCPGNLPLQYRLLPRRRSRPIHLLSQSLPSLHTCPGNVACYCYDLILQLRFVCDLAFPGSGFQGSGCFVWYAVWNIIGFFRVCSLFLRPTAKLSKNWINSLVFGLETMQPTD